MTHYPLPTRQQQAPHFSLVSILAVAAAIASFFFGWGMGLFLAVIAIVLGLIGILFSLAPNVRGGLVSVFATLTGLIGIIAAIGRLIWRSHY